MRYRNATYALVDSLRDALAHGQPVETRGTRTLELRNRLIVLERPRERCIVTPGRSNNIFATIAETMWVLAGRNDLAFLDHYLPRAKDFSDDGLTWRAGYGPRLRNWHGVDQLGETLRLLQDEPTTRRAVMSIFDPASDFVATKDVPCNNWIHWLVRDGRLHVNIAVRSSDIMWGFSGINAFEWSVLQEVMATWLGVAVGEMTFFASSLHLYERHRRRARSIIDRFPGITCYEDGLDSPRFQTSWDDFETLVQTWFQLEARSRVDPASIDHDVAAFSDPLLGHFLAMVQLYNGERSGWPIEYMDERLAVFPETDLTTAAYEFFHRRRPLPTSVIRQPAIARYLEQHTVSVADDNTGVEPFRLAVTRLHAQKSAAYGTSWKRRGEQISILANVARKVDRLEQMLDGSQGTDDESNLDTVVDLLVYCLKYQTFLADQDAAVAQELFGEPSAPITLPYSDGVDGFNHLLRGLDLALIGTGAERTTPAAIRVLNAFMQLEASFPADAIPDPVHIRCKRVQELTLASITLIGALRRDAPETFSRCVAAWRKQGD